MFDSSTVHLLGFQFLPLFIRGGKRAIVGVVVHSSREIVWPERQLVYLVLSLFSSLSLIHRPSQYFRFPFHELCFVPIAIPFPTVCMSRPSRNLPSLDYKELDRTGRRVYKARDNQPKMEDLRTAAINIESDVEDLFDSYDIKIPTLHSLQFTGELTKYYS